MQLSTPNGLPTDIPLITFPDEDVRYAQMDRTTWQVLILLPMADPPEATMILVTIRRLAMRSWQCCMSTPIEDLTITLDSSPAAQAFVQEECQERMQAGHAASACHGIVRIS